MKVREKRYRERNQYIQSLRGRKEIIRFEKLEEGHYGWSLVHKEGRTDEMRNGGWAEPGHLELCRVVERVDFVLSALGSLWKVKQMPQ